MRTCWRRPELCSRERVKKNFTFLTRYSHLSYLSFLLIYLICGPWGPMGNNCALGLEYGRTIKICVKVEVFSCAMTQDRWCKWGRKKREREGWKSFFIHFQFRQDFFPSTAMLRYVARKCCGFKLLTRASHFSVVEVVSVPIQGILPVLLMKKHLSWLCLC